MNILRFLVKLPFYILFQFALIVFSPIFAIVLLFDRPNIYYVEGIFPAYFPASKTVRGWIEEVLWFIFIFPYQQFFGY